MMEVLRCESKPATIEVLDQDREDFTEFKDILSAPKMSGEDVNMIDTTSSTQTTEQDYYDLKRLMIQERGEEEYKFLNKRKSKQMQD
jgi:hypothetical protein